jgi:hypothetical protein
MTWPRKPTALEERPNLHLDALTYSLWCSSVSINHAHVRKVLLARFGEDEDVITVDSDLHETPQHGLGLGAGTRPSGAARPAGRVEGEPQSTKDAVRGTH